MHGWLHSDLHHLVGRLMTACSARSMLGGKRHPRAMAEAVVDASALVDLLLGGKLGDAVQARLSGVRLHAPAHTDAEVLSVVGRLYRDRELGARSVEIMLARLAAAPIQRYLVSGLLTGAWSSRHQLRLADAIYIELATIHGLPFITTDRRLERFPIAEVVSV